MDYFLKYNILEYLQIQSLSIDLCLHLSKELKLQIKTFNFCCSLQNLMLQ